MHLFSTLRRAKPVSLSREDAAPLCLPALRLLRRRWLLPLLAFFFVASSLPAQTFRINSVSVTSGAYPASTSAVAAGVYGANLNLTGTLPTLAQQQQMGLLGCFYTGYGSTAGFQLSLPTSGNTEPLSIPASTIQTIPQTSFTSANAYTVRAKVYFIRNTQVCDGTFDSTLTNQVQVPVTAPSLGAYTGPVGIPQTNSATGVQAPPALLTLAASGVLYYGADSGSTTVSFGSFGSTSLSSEYPFVYVPVPAAFSSSPVGTTASLSICNTFTGSSSSTNSVCTSPSTPITLTVTALAASTGAITAAPNPVPTSGQSVLTAQFGASTGQTASPGAPSGKVSFVADGTTLPAAKLVLDKTATFSTQSTSITTPVAAAPVITPNGGTYSSAQTVRITDVTPGAQIFYTTDGSTPTSASTLYSGPLTVSTQQTIQAVAAASGFLNSAVASAVFNVNINPPSQLAFSVQPVTTPINTAIAPAVQVAIEDVNGNVVTSATNAVTVALASNPGEGTLAGTLTVNAMNGIATFADLALNSVATGYTLAASSGNLTPATSSAFNITPTPITMTVQSALVGIGSTLSGSFTLGSPAPAGGVTVTLSSDTPSNVTISPASVNVAQGQTTGAFTYTGVAAGSATVSASASGYQTGTVQVTGTSAQVSLGTIPPVAPGQMVSLALSLATAAPPGGTTVSFTSSNTGVATVTSSVFVPAGQRTAATNPQITGIIIGTTTITASAPGYAPDTRAVNVTVVATFNPSTTNINLSTSTNTTLNISAPAQTGGLAFTLSSDDPTIASVPSSVTVIQGSTSVAIPITGAKAGTTTIRANSTGVTEAAGSVVVSSAISGGSITSGYHLENSIGIYLPVAPPNPTTVTITANDPSIATISTSPGTVGTSSLTFNNVTSTYVGTIYVQGQSVNPTTLTISAPGYTNGSTAVTVNPSGFAFYGTPSFSTTTFSAPTSSVIYACILNPGTLSIQNFGYRLNPGLASFTLPVTSATSSVGASTSVIFNAGDSSQNTSFQPAGVGTSNITIGTPPAGFSVPSQYQQITATVTAPAIAVSAITTGVHLQNTLALYLPVAPPSPVTVTVTSNGSTLAAVSSSGTVVGGTTLTFPNVSSTYVGTIYVQGLSAGSTTITESAPGYTSGNGNIAVQPAGFVYYGTPSFSTTTFSSPSNITVYTATLDPQSLNVTNFGLAVSPGQTASVPVTSSSTSVGTITNSPLAFNPGDTAHSVTFQPSAAGTSNLVIGAVTGFSTPAQYQQITATVTAPAISIGNLTTGVHLQNSMGIYLPVAPPSPVTVTVTSSAPMMATLSSNLAVAGVTTLTFTNVSSTYVGNLYVQGQAVGASTMTVSAPGYTSGTGTATVDASGFAYYGTPNISTTTFSSPTGITVYSVVLDPGSLTIQGYQYALNPGIGPVSVPITDSAPSVGTLAASSLAFNTGDSYKQTTFSPVSAGMANITLGTPAGFSTPSQNQQITATVSAPVITLGNVTTGLSMQASQNLYLPVSPPNPVTVTVTSNGPLISTVSTSATVTGSTTLTFPNVTGTFVGTIYFQGQSLGSTTVTASAPGYTNGNATVTVDPSGFAFYGTPDFNTSVSSSPSTLTVYPVALNPGTLTVNNYNVSVNPGIGNVSVPVTSSDTSVGTITTSPLVFMPGAGYVQTSFQPLATGTSTISIGTPSGFSSPSQYTQITGTVQ